MKFILATSLLSFSLATAQQPSKTEIIAALVKASAFTHDHLSVRGGYLYAWSGDLQLREAEGIPDADTFWCSRREHRWWVRPLWMLRGHKGRQDFGLTWRKPRWRWRSVDCTAVAGITRPSLREGRREQVLHP